MGPLMSVTQVKEPQSHAAFPLFHLGGGWGVTMKWYQSQGLGGSGIEYKMEKHVSSNMLA